MTLVPLSSGAYLVLFIADPAGDEHAEAVRACVREAVAARTWPGNQPGWFDGAGDEEGTERTVGAYLRLDGIQDPEGPPVLVAAMARVSASLDVRVEVQVLERPVGALVGGEPDEALAARPDLLGR